MGSYNSEYENYYSNIRKRSGSGYPYKNNSTKKSEMSFLEKRIISELAGVLVLFCVVICCKIFITPTTKAIYDYSKNIVNVNYDYKAAIEKIKGMNISDIKSEKPSILQNAEDKVTEFTSKFKMENTN